MGSCLPPAKALLESLSSLDTNGILSDGYCGHSSLSTVEIWQFEDNGLSTQFQVNDIQCNDLPNWADRATPTLSGNQPRGGLRLLIGDKGLGWGPSQPKPTKEERTRMLRSIEHVSRSFDLPIVLLGASEDNPRFWCLPQTDEEEAQGIKKYYSNFSDFAIVWSFHPRKRMTQGILLFISEIAHYSREKVLIFLERNQSLAAQAELIPFVISAAASASWLNSLRRDGFHIQNLDDMLGDYLARLQRGQPTSHPIPFVSFSGDTTMRTARVARCQRALLALLELTRFVANDDCPTSTSSPSSSPQVKSAEQKAARDGLRCVQQTVQSLILNAETYQDRMSNQLSTISNIIAQQDQSISIELTRASKEIAFESKRDSSSMKTLALVTMVFLPGTFVSAFFAMPLFDWQSQTGHVIDHRIWIYFGVTIPLTILTLAGWWIWFRMMDKRDEKKLAEESQNNDKKTV